MNLIDELIEKKYLKTPRIIQAFRAIKREDFLREEDLIESGLNIPLFIGYGQTISQPLTVAFMLELLEPKADDKVLDIGSGSGWTTALLAEILGGKGKVFAIERIKELKEFGEQNVGKYNFIKKGTVKMVYGDGYKGLPKEAPFDKILVSATAREIPEALLKQLSVGGKLIIPIGHQGDPQDIVLVNKKGDNDFEYKRYPGFSFVPLVNG